MRIGMVEKRCQVCGKIYFKYHSTRKKTCGDALCIYELKKRHRLPSSGICSVCGDKKRLMRKGRKVGSPPLCKSCWYKVIRKDRECKTCGKVRRIYSQGNCQTCFIRLGLNSRKVVCRRCKREMAHYARGWCASCYVFLAQRKML